VCSTDHSLGLMSLLLGLVYLCGSRFVPSLWSRQLLDAISSRCGWTLALPMLFLHSQVQQPQPHRTLCAWT